MQLPEALREALGQVIADQRREWRRERELIEAQSREAIAELRARIVELEAELRQRVDARLAEVKDGAPGQSITAADVEPMISEAVARAVAAIPAPTNGKDADPAAIAALVTTEVHKALEGVALAEMDREDAGTEHALEEIKRIAAEIETLKAAPKGAVSFLIDAEGRLVGINADGSHEVIGRVRGEDGADADPAALQQLVREAVASAPPAKFPIVRAWEDRIYREAEVVTLDGAVWQALRETAKAPGHEDWRLIVAAGRDGLDGRSLNPRATWSPDETYARLDIVALDGGAFVARRDDPGPCPGDGWQLIAQRGKPGRPGERGEGIKGDRGPAGPAVVSIDMDETGLVTIENADGTTAQGDFARVLSRIAR